MTSLDALLSDPRYLPHRVDVAADRLQFVRTSRDRLAGASFLDGRSALTESVPVTVPLSAALAAAPAVGGVDRVLSHVSFCGSTLLARLCDVPGRVFSYKEPQALVDLTDAWIARELSGTSADTIEAALELVLGQLRLEWSPGEVTLVKPSNWINAILPLIARRSTGTRFALIDVEPRAFLLAVFRGGRDRIAYTLRAGAHLQVAFPELADAVATASGSGDPLLDAARWSAVTLALQRRMFDRVDPDRRRRLRYPEVVADQHRALALTAELLDLPTSSADRSEAIAARGAWHAKRKDHPFDDAARRDEDDEVERLHGERIDRALAWAEKALMLDLVVPPALL